MTVRHQRGVALIQVLLITTIILLLSVYFVTLAKTQVGKAREFQDRTQAWLNYYSAKNAVTYSLLTESREEIKEKGWNYHGQPFYITENVKISVQDLNGLYSLASLVSDERLKRILASEGTIPNVANVSSAILDWIDVDNVALPLGGEQSSYGSVTKVRNGPVQTINELMYIKGVNAEVVRVVNENMTFHPTPLFNPFSAPEAVLHAFTTDRNAISEVIKLREQHSISEKEVSTKLNLYSDEGIGYIIGPGFRLTIESRVNDSYFGQVEEFRVLPYRQYPLHLLSRRAKLN